MARRWEAIISFEDRSDHCTTSRWRLSGVKTKESEENTDSGVLWMETSDSANTLTVNLYKDDGLGAGDKVASGTADISSIDNTGANAAEVVLSASNSSGVSGSVWVHDHQGDDSCPVQVALATDEDLDALYDDIENLPGYDGTYGCAEFVRVAGEEIIGRLMAMYKEQVEGYGTTEAWYITDATRAYPDLRRLANPGQLRLACAHRALAIALGRSHQRADETMYSELRDYHNDQFERAMASLVLAFKAGSGDNANDDRSAGVAYQSRA